jgi:hypothetical protein
MSAALNGHGAMSELSPVCAAKRTSARAMRRPVQGNEIEPWRPDGIGESGFMK